MANKANPEQSIEMGYAFHQRLLQGDVTATAEIAEHFMEQITISLQKRFPQLDDPHMIDEAVTDAILNYFERPEQYIPSKRSLGGYLYMSARGDLLNLLNQEKNEAHQVALTEIVELSDSDSEHGVEVQDDFDLETWVLNQNSPVWQWLPHILPDPIDQEFVLLMMDGIRETSAYADVLGILDRPSKEQAAIVKRHKDRLKKKLQRHIKRSELSEDD